METVARRERIELVANNPMRIAGIQGVYGDPCGVEIVPVSLADALGSMPGIILLIDAGSVGPLFEVLRVCRDSCPLTRLIVIGLDVDETYIECVIAAGAKGFVGPDAVASEFAVALENVREGSIWAPRKVLSRLIEHQVTQRGGGDQADQIRLTPREDEIVALLIGGQSNRDIGTQLGIDEVTVKAHLGRIMRKAGVVNRIELTTFSLGRLAADRHRLVEGLKPLKRKRTGAENSFSKDVSVQ